MKRISILLLLPMAVFAVTDKIHAQAVEQTQTVHLATALDHLTVLEFGEPVTLAAAGSSAFKIEWQDNKVLIKPLKQGAATDLFVWTGSRRFAYELDPPGEAKNMNFAVDNPIAASKPVAGPSDNDRMTAVADMVLTRAFLGADHIESGDIKNARGHAIVRIENVFQSSNSLYIRYSVQNLTGEPYRVLKPSVYKLIPLRTTLSLPSIEHRQLDARAIRRLGETTRTPVVVSGCEVRKQDVPPGDVTRGVIVLRQQFAAPTVLEVVFADAGDHHVSATFVF